MKATLINNTNDDLMVVNAARVSFGKHKTLLDDSDVKLINYLAKHNHFSPFTHCFYEYEDVLSVSVFLKFINWRGHTEGCSFKLVDLSDVNIAGSLYFWIEFIKWHKENCSISEHKNLLSNLSKLSRSRHSLSAFGINFEETNKNNKAYCNHRFKFETFHVTAPIFVARQLAKHKVGFSWNEVSRRYVDSEPEFYMPDKWRKKASNKKQGSSTEAVQEPLYNRMHNSRTTHKAYERYNEYSLDLYKDMLDNETCPEQARMVLPQSTYTEWYWSATLENWNRMLNLRLKDDTQQETRELAEQINKQLMEKHE